ncbi:MAG: DNA/RNA non-specific endonuclease [Culicoidibacterales bacterium]
MSQTNKHKQLPEHWKKLVAFILVVILGSLGLLDEFLPTTALPIDVPAAYAQNQVIDVASCSLSGKREANVVVDIGFGDREYYAYTNEAAQLVYVQAAEVTLQTDDELAEGKTRYCNDEAKVPGTEAKDLDEGHVLADSLGGVGNAYNITPQESQLNRYGQQAEMEKLMRNTLHNGGTVTNFIAEITYPDQTTHTPEQYFYQMEINGELVTYEFFNQG